MKIDHVRPSVTHHLSLEQTVEQLARQREVVGVLQMGSGAEGNLGPASDIDLLIVLDGALPGVKMVSTTIADRLAEIYLVQTDELDGWIGELKTLPLESYAALCLRWIEKGRVLFDRFGTLEWMRGLLGGGEWGQAANDPQVYAAWYRTNYELAQLGRLVTAEDEVSMIKARIQLSRLPADLWERYFLVRRLAAASEKARIRWMKANDAEFLTEFLACLSLSEARARFQGCLELARRVLEPAGALWDATATAVELEGGRGEEARLALETWEGWFRA